MAKTKTMSFSISVLQGYEDRKFCAKYRINGYQNTIHAAATEIYAECEACAAQHDRIATYRSTLGKSTLDTLLKYMAEEEESKRAAHEAEMEAAVGGKTEREYGDRRDSNDPVFRGFIERMKVAPAGTQAYDYAPGIRKLVWDNVGLAVQREEDATDYKIMLPRIDDCIQKLDTAKEAYERLQGNGNLIAEAVKYEYGNFEDYTARGIERGIRLYLAELEYERVRDYFAEQARYGHRVTYTDCMNNSFGGATRISAGQGTMLNDPEVKAWEAAEVPLEVSAHERPVVVYTRGDKTEVGYLCSIQGKPASLRVRTYADNRGCGDWILENLRGQYICSVDGKNYEEAMERIALDGNNITVDNANTCDFEYSYVHVGAVQRGDYAVAMPTAQEGKIDYGMVLDTTNRHVFIVDTIRPMGIARYSSAVWHITDIRTGYAAGEARTRALAVDMAPLMAVKTMVTQPLGRLADYEARLSLAIYNHDWRTRNCIKIKDNDIPWFYFTQKWLEDADTRIDLGFSTPILGSVDAEQEEHDLNYTVIRNNRFTKLKTEKRTLEAGTQKAAVPAA